MFAANTLLNLLPAALSIAPSPLKHGPNLWLAVLVVLLGLAAIAMPIVIKREAVLQMLPWVDRAKKAAETVDTMRRDLDARIERHNFVLGKRENSPAVIQLLEELTRVLPDDTWVQTLDIKGKELQIQGETASSVRLIGLFEQSSVFKDASFRSSLTKGQVSGTEHYQLALQIRPIAKPASAPEMPQLAAEKKP
jgi:general secretion pathway protein L